MIIVKTMGGLGNQMFQYAFARHIEKETGYDVKIDTSYFSEIPQGDTKRTELLTCLFPHFDIASKEEVNYLREKETSFLRRILCRLKLRKKIFLTEEDVREKKNLVGIKDAYLEGYWQSEHFFQNAVEDVKKELSFPVFQLDEQGRKYLDRIEKAAVAISIHVRAGDYLKKDNFTCFGNICTPEYYQKACYYMEDKYPDCIFFLFSNDIIWTKKNIDLDYERVVVVEDWKGKQEWIDMFLMSQCAHNIVANSSYSWWGAWLNQHADKVVLCPSKWMNNDANEDTICKEWIRFNNFS